MSLYKAKVLRQKTKFLSNDTLKTMYRIRLKSNEDKVVCPRKALQNKGKLQHSYTVSSQISAVLWK